MNMKYKIRLIYIGEKNIYKIYEKNWRIEIVIYKIYEKLKKN